MDRIVKAAIIGISIILSCQNKLKKSFSLSHVWDGCKG